MPLEEPKPSIHEAPSSHSSVSIIRSTGNVDENARTIIQVSSNIQKRTKSRVWTFLLGVAVGSAGGGALGYSLKSPSEKIVTIATASASTSSPAEHAKPQTVSTSNSYDAPPPPPASPPPSEDAVADPAAVPDTDKVTPERLLEEIKKRNMQLEPSQFTGNGRYLDVMVMVEEKSEDGVNSDKVKWHSVDEYKLPEKFGKNKYKIPEKSMIIAVYSKKPEYAAAKSFLFDKPVLTVKDPDHPEIEYNYNECAISKNGDTQNGIFSLVVNDFITKSKKRKKSNGYLQVYDFQCSPEQVENQQ